MIYKVVQYPDPILLKPTLPVETVGSKEKTLVYDMIDTMHAEHGVGIGANQVGVALSIFVACPDAQRGHELIFINPVITDKKGSVSDLEGCLSIPGFVETVKRFKHVTVKAMDLKGCTIEVKAEGFLARIFQHEIDHLNGLLYIDRLSFLNKRRIMKKLKHAPTANL